MLLAVQAGCPATVPALALPQTVRSRARLMPVRRGRVFAG